MRTDVVEEFRTSAVQAPERVRFWNRLAAQTFGAMRIDPGTGSFGGCLRRRQIGALSLAHVISTPAHVRGLAGARRTARGGMFLLLNERGTSHHRQAGRDALLQPGEVTLLRADQPYSIDFTRDNEVLVMHLPDAGQMRFAADEHVARRHACGESALLASFMRRLDSTDCSAAPHLVQTAFDLLYLTWPQSSGTARRRPMHAWQLEARRHVAIHFHDPSLDAVSIADALGVSARYVHMIFAGLGTTASGFVNAYRLELAAQRLREDAGARISDIAMDCGFRDLSDFCRRFRRRYGVSARIHRTRRNGQSLPRRQRSAGRHHD